MNNVFKLKIENHYNLRQVSKFYRPIVKAVYHGIESVSIIRGTKNMAYTARKIKQHGKSRKF